MDAQTSPESSRHKVIGIGLNKTGTKTLRHYLQHWSYRHMMEYDAAFQFYRDGRITELLDFMRGYESFEDWPWPLVFREIDERFPNARFILTVRRDPDTWYRSLCNMAVRIGPLDDYDRHVYGYGMPQGRRQEHVAFYEAHNEAVMSHFRDRPGKVLRVCWEEDPSPVPLAAFLGEPPPAGRPAHANRSTRMVYSGDNLLVAHANRVVYQATKPLHPFGGRALKAVRHQLGRLRRSIRSGPSQPR